MRLPGTAFAFVGTLLLAAQAQAIENLKHGPVQEPEVAALVEAKNLRIGRITHAVSDGGMVYVAGEEGVAAIGADGKPAWAARLPRADVRTIGVDGTSIAFVAQMIVTPDPNPLESFLQGTLAKLPSMKDSTVGLLDKGRRGAVLWTVPYQTEYRMAPPALSGPSIGVTDGASLALLDRSSGAVRQRVKTVPSLLAGMKVIESMTRNTPLFADESFIVGFVGGLISIDTVTGKEKWNETNHGLMAAFHNITAGPILWGDKIAFGNSNSARSEQLNTNTRVFVSDLRGKEVWNERNDKMSGVGSLYTVGDRLFAASNFTLTAYDPKGKVLWEKETERNDGALTMSPYRGIRYQRNSVGAQVIEGVLSATLGMNDSDDAAYRTSYGNCLAADERYVYVTSMEKSSRPSKWDYAQIFPGTSLGGRDVITVVDANNGNYVKTLDAKGRVIELLVAGPNLVVVDLDQVRFFKREN